MLGLHGAAAPRMELLFLGFQSRHPSGLQNFGCPACGTDWQSASSQSCARSGCAFIKSPWSPKSHHGK
jgi:hypothetical protein